MTKTKLIKTASGMEVEQDGKSYPVRSEDEWIEFAPFGFDVFEVKIPSERVRIVETEQQIKYTNGEYSRSSQMIKYATLLTEDKEGEGQGDAVEFAEWIQKEVEKENIMRSVIVGKYLIFENDDVIIRKTTQELYEQFKITRL